MKGRRKYAWIRGRELYRYKTVEQDVCYESRCVSEKDTLWRVDGENKLGMREICLSCTAFESNSLALRCGSKVLLLFGRAKDQFHRTIVFSTSG